MFSFFKKSTELQKLEKEYRKLLQEAFELSTSNRTKSDEKTYQAEQIAIKIQKTQKH